MSARVLEVSVSVPWPSQKSPTLRPSPAHAVSDAVTAGVEAALAEEFYAADDAPTTPTIGIAREANCI